MVYTIEDLRRIIAPIAEQYGLRAVYVFGSYARGEANADSDIDLLVDLTGTNIRSLFALGSVYCDLESALGKSIDLIPVAERCETFRYYPYRVYFELKKFSLRQMQSISNKRPKAT